MTNYPFTSIDQFEDLAAKQDWLEKVASGKVMASVELEHLRGTSRDNARTPMQWTAGSQAGFTSGVPWLPVNPNASEINAETEDGDDGSVLTFYRHLIALRKGHPVLVYGAYRDIEPSHPNVFACTRVMPGSACLIMMNFSRTAVDYKLPPTIVVRERLLSDRAGKDVVLGSAAAIHLAGWQSLVLSVDPRN